MSELEETKPLPKIPSPAQLHGVAKTLRGITSFQAMQPFGKILGTRTLRTIADSLDECARLRSTTARSREARLEEKVDALSILATSRRLPIAAIEGIVRRAEQAGEVRVSVEEIRRALAATEPKP